MARVLVSSLPFAGHVGPTSAVAAELVRRGHRVVAYTGTKYHGRFLAVGAEWLPWRRARDFDDARLAATFPGLGGGKGLRGAWRHSARVFLGTAAGQAADLLDAARRQPFDLVVTDQLAFGAALAAEALDVPWASVAVTPLTLPGRHLPPPGLSPAAGPVGRVRDAVLRPPAGAVQRRLATPRVNRVRAAAGLGPRTVAALEDCYSPYLVVAQGVPALEFDRPDLPAHVRFVGRLAPPARSTVPLPDWWPELVAARADGRPVVHVTQGTLDNDPDDLLRPAVAGLAGTAPLVLCATGGPAPSVLGPLPDNVRVAAFLPYDRLLPLVDVMVTNGGWGGTLGGLAAGVPLVVAGRSLDKPDVARRVAWSGAGLDLRTDRPGPTRIRRAVQRVLAGPGFRRRAGELAVALTGAGGAGRAADRIEALLDR
ncbi:glycosyltransferase [Micromonospora cathayae]|uniref:Erythromycin biosynthesis protein CIII-like C-terminal domain-containing protein n=1 Tax=Micromonospora cathayae TaxID=3028804 RepID=A0ABY7ZUP5_9ACTN|nr:nucleotide disphospho-sugar-binding domain-containing protein [Micromonospora sp. HUAS 3]WDZ85763.1 hypothetical protein PVK37_04785 [Micromonospora sp. HUAS 3]